MELLDDSGKVAEFQILPREFRRTTDSLHEFPFFRDNNYAGHRRTSLFSGNVPGLAEVIEPLLSSMETLKREIACLDAMVMARAGADPTIDELAHFGDRAPLASVRD